MDTLFSSVVAALSFSAVATPSGQRCDPRLLLTTPLNRDDPEKMRKDPKCQAHASGGGGTHVGDPLGLDGDSVVSDADEAEYLELTGSGSGSGGDR